MTYKLSSSGLELLKDVQTAVTCVNEAVTSNISQNQFDALVSVAYDIGSSSFQNSELLQLVNEEKWEEASEQFLVLSKKHSRGMFVEIVGLKEQRLKEQALFLTPCFSI